MLRAKCLRRNTWSSCKRHRSHDVSATSQAVRLNAIIDPQPGQSTPAPGNVNGVLSGKCIGIKANIVCKDSVNSAASRVLSSFRSPFDATVVKLLRQNGASVLPNLNMDEFGMGSHSQNSSAGPVLSPYNRRGIPLSPGGSSGGSAVAVATGTCSAALGTDTGGSVRLPAAYTGVVGFKPSYGLLSRWGVIQYANSLDTVGVLAQDVSTVREVFECLSHYDSEDPTSLPPSVRAQISGDPHLPSSTTLRIGIPLEYNISELSSIVRRTYIAALKWLQALGHTLHPVSLPSTRLALSSYYILAPAEASSNLAKYDGIRYGHRTSGPDAQPNADPALPLFAPSRGEAFGDEVKRRILLGAYTLSADAMDNYFIQAQKVRRMVQLDFDRVFARRNPLLDDSGTLRDGGGDEVDVLLTPTAPTLPPTIEEVKGQSPVESYMNDVFTVPASLAGLPAASVPVPLAYSENADASDVQSVGMQIIGQFGDDETVLRLAEIVESLQQDS